MDSPRSHLLVILILQAAHLCLMPHGAAALNFSYNFTIPDPGGLQELMFVNGSARRSDLIYLSVPGKTNSTGRAFYAKPVRLWDRRTGKRASFNTSFSFVITRGENDNSSLALGEGMAFFIAPFPTSLPPVSGGPFLGLFSNLTSSPATPATVGVEFDTHWDRDLDPKDINANHVGINLNSIRSVSYTKDMLKGELFGAMTANITYDAGSKIMVVTLRLAGGGTHSIQALIDFVAAGVPQEVAIGFSAATGVDVFETHLLLSWSFSSTDLVSVSSNMPLWLIISLSVATPLLAATVVAALVWGIMRTQRRAQAGMNIPLRVAKEFSYEELSMSTNNFSDDRKLGAGAFGEVYRGLLRYPGVPDMLPVAVKMLIRQMDPQTRRDYVTEIMTLGQLSHRNLVRLIGWSNGGGRKDKPLLLVYELVPNRSLDEHLHGHDRLLQWPERYNVVRDLGHAIEYLHTGSKEPILHRDIKPANVMLDDEFRAKLGDFGLVRQVHPGEESLAGTAMVGTCDYMDPKCLITFTASTASDMYSFGVLLLEIATGRRPRVLMETGHTNLLVKEVRESYHKGALLEVADPRLKGDFDQSQMRQVLLVGLLCVQPDRKDRPDIRDAVNLLANPSHTVPQIDV